MHRDLVTVLNLVLALFAQLRYFSISKPIFYHIFTITFKFIDRRAYKVK